jgi:hypothetical protein
MQTIPWRTIIARFLTATGLFAAAVVTAAPAVAGDDPTQLPAQEQARQTAVASRVRLAQAAPDSEMETLQLDHGPRATTTPWANQQRRLRNQQRQMRNEAAASAGAQASAAAR